MNTRMGSFFISFHHCVHILAAINVFVFHTILLFWLECYCYNCWRGQFRRISETKIKIDQWQNGLWGLEVKELALVILICCGWSHYRWLTFSVHYYSVGKLVYCTFFYPMNFRTSKFLHFSDSSCFIGFIL